MAKKEKDYTMWFIIIAIIALMFLAFSCTSTANNKGGIVYVVQQLVPSEDSSNGETTAEVTTTTSSTPTTTMPTTIPYLPEVGFSCSDSDRTYADPTLIAGKCLDEGAAYKYDTCVDGRTVREYYCDNGCQYIDKSCPIGHNCINGACEKVSCETLIDPSGQRDCGAAYPCREGSCQYVESGLFSRTGKCECWTLA